MKTINTKSHNFKSMQYLIVKSPNEPKLYLRDNLELLKYINSEFKIYLKDEINGSECLATEAVPNNVESRNGVLRLQLNEQLPVVTSLAPEITFVIITTEKPLLVTPNITHHTTKLYQVVTLEKGWIRSVKSKELVLLKEITVEKLTPVYNDDKFIIGDNKVEVSSDLEYEEECILPEISVRNVTASATTTATATTTPSVNPSSYNYTFEGDKNSRSYICSTISDKVRLVDETVGRSNKVILVLDIFNIITDNPGFLNYHTTFKQTVEKKACEFYYCNNIEAMKNIYLKIFGTEITNKHGFVSDGNEPTPVSMLPSVLSPDAPKAKTE